MKANIKLLKKQRRYSAEFKQQIVSEFESGKFSVPQLERLHGISNQCIYRWIYKFSNFNDKGFRVIEMKDSSEKKVKDLENRIKELERIVGRKQIENDYMEKIIELAKSELNIDLKKNYGTQHSSGSDKTGNQ